MDYCGVNSPRASSSQRYAQVHEQDSSYHNGGLPCASGSQRYTQVHGQNLQNLLFCGGATILGTAATVLVAKGAWHGFKGAYSVASWGLSHSWDSTKWVAKNGWNITKATPSAIWGTTRWTAKTSWDATKWTAVTAWEVSRWTGKTAWSATKWTASTGFSIAKYVLVNIPAAIKWTALTVWGAAKWSANIAWSCTKWTFSCIRHPIASIQNAFNNTIALIKGTWNLVLRTFEKTLGLYETYLLPVINSFIDFMIETSQDFYQFCSKHVQIITHDLNKTFPAVGYPASKVKGYALTAFGFASRKATAIAEKILPYNPVPWLFKRIPSMKTPIFSAMGAATSSLAADLIPSSIGSLSTEASEYIRKSRKHCAKAIRAGRPPGQNELKIVSRDQWFRFRIDLFIMSIGTIMLAPRLANYFSKHTVTQMQATGWGLTFLAIKTILASTSMKTFSNFIFKSSGSSEEYTA